MKDRKVEEKLEFDLATKLLQISEILCFGQGFQPATLNCVDIFAVTISGYTCNSHQLEGDLYVLSTSQNLDPDAYTHLTM